MLSSKESYIELASLVNEINDTIAEQVCGGLMTTPQTTEENSSNTEPTTGDATNVPSMQADNNLGLIPFFPNLPATKLPRLGRLDISNRNPTTPKNALTVTIPLPLAVGS